MEIILGLLGAFLLFIGGCFWGSRRNGDDTARTVGKVEAGIQGAERVGGGIDAGLDRLAAGIDRAETAAGRASGSIDSIDGIIKDVDEKNRQP